MRTRPTFLAALVTLLPALAGWSVAAAFSSDPAEELLGSNTAADAKGNSPSRFSGIAESLTDGHATRRRGSAISPPTSFSQPETTTARPGRVWGSFVREISEKLIERAGPKTRRQVALEAMRQARQKSGFQLKEGATHAEEFDSTDGRRYEVLFRVVALSEVKARFAHQEAATGAIRFELRQRGVAVEAVVIPLGYSKAKRKNGRTGHARSVEQHRKAETGTQQVETGRRGLLGSAVSDAFLAAQAVVRHRVSDAHMRFMRFRNRWITSKPRTKTPGPTNSVYGKTMATNALGASVGQR